MRKQKIQTLTIAVGMLLAAAIVCSNVFLLERTAEVKQVVKSEKAKDEKETHSFTTAPTITPPTSFYVELNVASHCLFDIVTPTENEEASCSNFTLLPQKYLLILFRVIISPNAP
jgi:hypothetical protein